MNKYSIFIITIRVDKQASHNLHHYYNTLQYKINLKILQNTFR
jgi:hypothetical protein